MKTEMNPDLEFLRGLRERLRFFSENFQQRVENYRQTKNPLECYLLEATSIEDQRISDEITDYLKTRGIE